MCYIFIHLDHLWHLIYSKVMISFGKPSILVVFVDDILAKSSYAASMATGMHMDERRVECLVFGDHDQDRTVSAKSVTMRGTYF